MRNLWKAAVAATAVASFVTAGAIAQAGAVQPGAATSRTATSRTVAPLTAVSAAATATPPKALLGMAAPQADWAQRVKEVGPGLEARRIFLTSFTAGMSQPLATCNAGMYPVISLGTGSYTWAQVAAGKADADLRAMATKLAALPCDVFVTIQHEPYGNGTPADWSSMEAHALPLLGPDPGVKVGVIANGWWWSSMKKGYTDAEIAQWIPKSVINVSDVIAADTYQSNPTGEDGATKMRNMVAWAKRVGGVKALGVGEFNSPTAAGITAATNELSSEPMFAWGCLWNANYQFATVLTGDRLTAFKKALASW